MHTVHRARRKAEFAPGTDLGNHRVHQFGRADNGIDRTRLDAFGAADAVLFDNHRHHRGCVHAAGAVIGAWWNLEQPRECACAGIASGRAAVDSGLAARQRFGIGPAAVKSALAALGLREQAVEAFDEGGRD